MKPAEPFLQPAIVGVDVVEAKIKRCRVRFAGYRKNMRRDPGAAREGNNSGAAIAIELVGRRHHTTQRSRDERAVQSPQHRIRGATLSIARDKHRDLFSRQPTFGRLAAPLARRPQHARAVPCELFQDEGLVAFNNASHCLGFVTSKRRQNRCRQRNAVV